MNYKNKNLINNSSDYMNYSSLFEDFEILSKLTNKHLEEDNLIAAMRCMKVMRLILDELKQKVLK